jgi:hypothetical protein
MEVVIALVSLPNCSPRSLALKDTLKKLKSQLTSLDSGKWTHSYPSIVHASHPEKNINHAKGLTIASSLNGFFVTFSSPAGGVCQVGIMALKNDLLFR